MIERKSIFAINIAMVLGVCSALHAADSGQLVLDVQMPREIKQCHVVEGVLTLRNIGETDFTVAMAVPPFQLSRVAIEIENANGTPFFKGLLAPERILGGGGLLLKAGERLALPFQIVNGWRDNSLSGTLFPKAGIFRVRFLFTTPNRSGGVLTVTSKWSEMTVDAPDRENTRALNALQGMIVSGYLFEPDESFRPNGLGAATDDRDKIMNDLVQFIDQFPKSYWTPFARLFLGTIYSEQGKQHPNAPDLVNRAVLQKAVEQLESASAAKEFPFVAQARSRLESVKDLLEKNPPPKPPPPPRPPPLP
jgi:hypothetical protein